MSIDIADDSWPARPAPHRLPHKEMMMSATIGDEIRKIAERYQAKLATARDDALEEAAKVAGKYHDRAEREIRALKSGTKP